LAFGVFLVAGIGLLSLSSVLSVPSKSQSRSRERTAYLGFDRNIYPGDEALAVVRKDFAFTGYWLSPPPGESLNTWSGKRALLRSQGWGFALLYRGPENSQLKTEAEAEKKGVADAHTASATAKREGFPRRAVIFLDIENGGRLPTTYHAYLRAWANELPRDGYRAGVYCSGMPVNEGSGVTIITADDVRNNISTRDVVYWVYNYACPPSPGCAVRKDPPGPTAAGVPYASVWQISQSPQRKEFTLRCASTYYKDGNCYAPSDTAHAWFLDINTAVNSDPSGGGR
jgi:Domain of unknown function (DUF1906)